jgi:hypothetical protein
MENSVMFRKNGISECVRPSMKKNHIKIYLREIFYLVSTTYGGSRDGAAFVALVSADTYAKVQILH